MLFIQHLSYTKYYTHIVILYTKLKMLLYEINDIIDDLESGIPKRIIQKLNCVEVNECCLTSSNCVDSRKFAYLNVNSPETIGVE